MGQLIYLGRVFERFTEADGTSAYRWLHMYRRGAFGERFFTLEKAVGQ